VHPGRIDGVSSLERPSTPTLVAIGNFDGVHRGHRAVLEAAVARAGRENQLPVVLTFDPHPAEVLGREKAPVLTSLERKAELLCRLSPELRVVVEPFTRELARMSPRQFASELLVAKLNAKLVLVGENFRFGHERSGDFAELARLGSELGFRAESHELAGDASGGYSSTRVRAALAAGDLAEAERLLSRPHALTGTVVPGQSRGRAMGFATANLDGVVEALPPHGVYACVVDRARPGEAFVALGLGVMNLGVRPTLGAGFSAEVHVLDFDEDLYGARLRLHLCARLREELRFSDVSALKQQIAADIAEARRLLSGRSKDPRARGAWY
jgi:riboflavin kinase/FMN adenylyltransferase